MQSRLAGAQLRFLGLLWCCLPLFCSGGNYLWSCSFFFILCSSCLCPQSMSDAVRCQITSTSGPIPCDAFLQRLVCCISIGTNRAYGTLLVLYTTFLMYFSNVQYMTDIFLCHLKFLFSLKLAFVGIVFRGNRFFCNCTFLYVFRLNDILVNYICYGI